MYIGELARRSGASPRAIRLYESLGLLRVTRKGSYRIYDNTHLEFVWLIKEAQNLGVTLSEIQQLQTDAREIDWPALNQLLIHKRQQALADMAQLQQHIERIERYQSLIAGCVAQRLDQCDFAREA